MDRFRSQLPRTITPCCTRSGAFIDLVESQHAQRAEQPVSIAAPGRASGLGSDLLHDRSCSVSLDLFNFTSLESG